MPCCPRAPNVAPRNSEAHPLLHFGRTAFEHSARTQTIILAALDIYGLRAVDPTRLCMLVMSWEGSQVFER